MRITIIFLTILFLFIAFFGKLNYVVDNPFLAYIFYVLNLFIKFFPIILILFSIISGYYIWQHYKHSHPKRKTFNSFFQIFEILIISSFSAYVLLLLIGIIQLNIYSILLNKKPDLIGIKSNTEDIYNSMRDNNVYPKIIISTNNSKDGIYAIAKATSGTENFYGEIVIPNIPKLFVFPINKKLSNLMFLDNTLIVKELNIENVEKLSPIIGVLLLKNYFPNRDLKNFPIISVMDEKEYENFRIMDAKEKIAKINSESLRMRLSISSLSASITQTEEEIERSKQLQIKILEDRDKEYNKCLSVGDYDDKNNFIPKNSRNDCQSILDSWEAIYINEESNGKELAKQIDEEQEKLKIYQYYDNFFKAQEELSDITIDNIPSELGVFIPDKTVKVVLLNSESNYIADYLETLIHEYLHYESYTPEKRLESSFFEEGLTEYFARQTISNSMKIDINMGYPIAFNIIKQISNRISEADLAEIYFNKNQALLEEKLNLVYGENFYKDNIVYFESLMYTSNDDQAIELANRIIKNMNGNPLNNNDL